MVESRRVILHVDMDAFFVSVELRRRPELVGLPVVVGGAGRRGVVAAASYEARRYGVHSALASSLARRRCPQAVFLPGDHALYASVSADVQRIFHTFTPLVEPLSLDVGFLDVSGGTRLLGDGPAIAQMVRTRIAAELQLGCSVGVAANKFLAKLASVQAKPQATVAGVLPGAGVVEVVAGGELEFLHPLPVAALWGVGPATLERLARLGVRTVGDLAQLDEALLVSAVGAAHGRHLHRLSTGRDDRPVEPDRTAQSIGHEETYPHDLHRHDELRVELARLADGVATRLRAATLRARTLTLKVRFADFTTITRSVTLCTSGVAGCDTAHGIIGVVGPLLAAIDPGPGVRLLGVSASNFTAASEQLQLDGMVDDDRPAGARSSDWQATEATVDAIRARFGVDVIGPANAIGARGLRVVRRGAQHWGPDGSR